MTSLLGGTDALYAWMLGGPAPIDNLSLPPDGASPEPVIAMLREAMKAVRNVHTHGDWLIVDGSEVVGLCGLKYPADSEGRVEIGYGVTPSRQGLGHAKRALSLMLEELSHDPKIRRITAETAVGNRASQRVLEANGFIPCGRRVDPEDGELLCWQLPTAAR